MREEEKMAERSKLRRFGSPVLLIVAGSILGAIGTVFVYGRTWSQLVEQISAAKFGEVGMQVVVLSHLRLGEEDEAIQLLEDGLDNLVLSVDLNQRGAGKEPLDDPGWVRSLRVVKAYREICPREGGAEPSIGGILDPVSVDDEWLNQDCPSPVRRLARQRQP